MVGTFFTQKWGAIMYCEFVYVGYSTKQCVEFLNGIEEKLKAHDKDFEYNRKNLLIMCKSFKIRGLPIYSGNLGCHGMENAQYICKETARPKDFTPSPEECLNINAILDYIQMGIRITPIEKSEKELVELIDTLIGVQK